MDSKEFGLVAVQQIFKIQSLHYGFWENSETASINGIAKAQEKYTLFLCEPIEEAVGDDKTAKILDVGCGTGAVTRKLLQMEYNADGLVPSNWGAKMAQENTTRYKSDEKGRIYESTFEDFATSNVTDKYQVVFLVKVINTLTCKNPLMC